MTLSSLLLAATVLVSAGHSSHDLLRADLDTKVNPGVDFFEYANGGWLKRNPIPASESSWGIGGVIQLELYGRLRKIDEDAAKKGGAPGSAEQKVGDFWATAMDETKAEQLGLSPL
jgi:putative endopeptidase